MRSGTWKTQLGSTVWDYLAQPLRDVEEAQREEMLADILTRITEVGWRGPMRELRVAPNRGKVLWPGPKDEKGEDTSVAVLTSEGLEQYYRKRGHRFFLLRVPQLLRAAAGPLAARLQEMLAGYEEQCAHDGVTPLPEFADVKVFVGGESEVVGPELLRGLIASVEEP